MQLPPDIIEKFRAEGKRGGTARAAKMSEAQRKAHSRKMHAALTPAERTAKAKRINAGMSTEQKRERAMKGVKARMAKKEAKASRDTKAG